MTKTNKLVRGKEAQGSKYMWFDDKDYPADLYKKDFLNPFHYGGRPVNKIHFYNEEGIVITQNSGWFTVKGFSNNRLETITFEDGIATKRKVNFKDKQVYVILSQNNNIFGEKCWELYIPMSHLDAYGWAIVETITEHDHETHYETNLFVGGECTESDHLFHIGIQSRREKHWDKLKETLMERLAQCNSQEEFVKVVQYYLPVR